MLSSRDGTNMPAKAMTLSYSCTCVCNVCVEGVITSSPQDEEYARQLQRELDEEYARQLQREQDVPARDSDVSLSDQDKQKADIVSGYHDVQ